MNKFLPYSLALASLTFTTNCSGNKSTETIIAPPIITAAASDSTTAPASLATQYTCPMHPEVVTDHPGKCPKCGMDLVVKK